MSDSEDDWETADVPEGQFTKVDMEAVRAAEAAAAAEEAIRREREAEAAAAASLKASREQAQREAMDRYLTEMEIRASEAIADRRQWEEHLERCLQQEREDIERKRQLATENSDFIKQQMDWNRTKRKHERKTFVRGASARKGGAARGSAALSASS